MPFLRCLKNDDFLLTFEVCACCMMHGFSSPDLPGFLFVPNAQVRAIVKTLMRSPFVAISTMLLLVSLVISKFPCFLNFPRTSNPMVLKVEFLTMVPHHAPHIWFLRSTCDVTSCLKSRCQLAIFKEQRPRVLRKRWSESEIKLQWLICTLLQCGGGSSVKKNYRPHIKLADVHAPSCTYIYTMLRFGLGYRSSHILHHAPPCPCTMKTV